MKFLNLTLYSLPAVLSLLLTLPAAAGGGPDLEREQRLAEQTVDAILDGDPVYLTRLQWDIDRVERDYPDLTLSATKEMMV